MSEKIATARSLSNIAFIKYWGNRHHGLRLPENGSLSMNLANLETVTTVCFEPDRLADELVLNEEHAAVEAAERVSQHLDNIRRVAGTDLRAYVISHNNFPVGTGIASSASAFAALTVAACAALNLDLNERALSALARLGSGSASRSVPGGYVEWYPGFNHDSSFAETIAPPDHWDLVDLVAIVSKEHKAVGSTDGHKVAPTSPLQDARVSHTELRLNQCRQAIIDKDFDSFAQIVEHDALLMHAVMMTSRPSLMYWDPATLRLIHTVQQWRAEGVPACFTVDAGPNVHVITTAPYREKVIRSLTQIEGVSDVLVGTPGGPTILLDEHLQWQWE